MLEIINSKSILNCNHSDILQHQYEIEQYLLKITKLKNFECAVIFKYFDIANKDKKPVIKQCKLYDCLDMTQYVDQKNGIDITYVDNFLTFICYGENYLINDKTYITTTGIQIRPYNKKRDFINIKDYINNAE